MTNDTRYQMAWNSGQIVDIDGAKAWLDQNRIFARNIGQRNATGLAMPVETVEGRYYLVQVVARYFLVFAARYYRNRRQADI